MADYDPLQATEKSKRKDEEEFVEKEGAVMAADDLLPAKRAEEEEGSVAAADLDDSDEDEDDDESGYISGEDPRFFTKSYWEAKEKESDYSDVDHFDYSNVEHYVCFEKFKLKEIDIEDSTWDEEPNVDGVVKRRKLSTPMMPSLLHYYTHYKLNTEIRAEVDYLAAEAIKRYNLYNDEEYKLKKVVNVNAMRCAGMSYYITFRAENNKASDSPSELFETLGYYLVDGRRGVFYCRPQHMAKLLEVLERKYVRTVWKKQLPK